MIKRKERKENICTYVYMTSFYNTKYVPEEFMF